MTWADVLDALRRAAGQTAAGAMGAPAPVGAAVASTSDPLGSALKAATGNILIAVLGLLLITLGVYALIRS